VDVKIKLGIKEATFFNGELFKLPVIAAIEKQK
jgi:hypothetical protein